MWTRGPKDRTTPPRGYRRQTRGRYQGGALRPTPVQAMKPVGRRRRVGAWRRAQQRWRTLWNWVILRTIRTWYPGRSASISYTAGDVRLFSSNRGKHTL